jgi:hypothetical protein
MPIWRSCGAPSNPEVPPSARVAVDEAHGLAEIREIVESGPHVGRGATWRRGRMALARQRFPRLAVSPILAYGDLVDVADAIARSPARMTP